MIFSLLLVNDLFFFLFHSMITNCTILIHLYLSCLFSVQWYFQAHLFPSIIEHTFHHIKSLSNIICFLENSMLLCHFKWGDKEILLFVLLHADLLLFIHLQNLLDWKRMYYLNLVILLYFIVLIKSNFLVQFLNIKLFWISLQRILFLVNSFFF